MLSKILNIFSAVKFWGETCELRIQDQDRDQDPSVRDPGQDQDLANLVFTRSAVLTTPLSLATETCSKMVSTPFQICFVFFSKQKAQNLVKFGSFDNALTLLACGKKSY